MKLGILGTGMIVKDFLTTIDKLDIESISILGTAAAEVETKALVKQYQMDECYFDYDKLLASEIDTVYVALPNHLHYLFAKKALLRNKHVIIEKPITANAAELKDLTRIAEERNLIILEAMNIHYLPAFQALKEKLPEIGAPKIISFNYSQYSSRYDAFKRGTILPAFDYTKAGGALMDINVYNINAIVGLFGKPKEIRYLANIEKKIDTSGTLLMDYGNFKAVSIGAKDCKAPIVSTLQGDQGSIRIDSPVNQMTAFEHTDNRGNKDYFATVESEHRLYYEFVEFTRIIDEVDLDKARATLEISLTVSEIMEEARMQEGITFANDEQYAVV